MLPASTSSHRARDDLSLISSQESSAQVLQDGRRGHLSSLSSSNKNWSEHGRAYVRRYSSRKIYWSIRLLAIFASDVIFYFSRDTNKELAPLERIYIHWIYLFLFNSLRTSVFNHDQRIFRSYLYSTNFYEVFMALKKGTRKNHLTSQEQVPSDRCRRFVISQMTNDRSLPFEPHKFWIILLMHSCYPDCIFSSTMKRL